jgi:hypothetical protein
MKIYYYTEAIGRIEYRRVSFLGYLGHLLTKAVKFAVPAATGYAAFYDFLPVTLPLTVRIAVIGIMGSVLYNSLVFCNGWMIGLFWKKDPDWKIIYNGCLIYTYGSSMIGICMLLQQHFPTHPLICAFVAACVAYFVYTRYQFLKDEAPPACIGFYKAGLRTSD